MTIYKERLKIYQNVCNIQMKLIYYTESVLINAVVIGCVWVGVYVCVCVCVCLYLCMCMY